MVTAEEFLNDAIYAIVAFDEYDHHQKKLIELVPRSWITIDEEDNCTCRYPPTSMAQAYMTQWLKNLKEPEDTWSSHTVEIISKANNYTKGLRRLYRAFTTAQAASDFDDIYQPELRNDTVHREIQQMFDETSSIIVTEQLPQGNSGSPETSTSNQNQTHHVNEHSRKAKKRKASSDGLNPTVIENNTKEKSSSKIDDKLTELKNSMTSKQKIMAEYVDLKFEIMEKKITNAKRSILYDLKNRTRDNVSTSNQPTSTAKTVDNSWKEKINIELPIKDAETFSTFDDELKVNLEKQAALKTMYQILTDGSNYEKAIKMIMSEMISKEVQLLYSGAGRITKKGGKLNFSTTNTFTLIEDFIKEKYGNENRQFKVLTIVSTFLSGAGDRDGGRISRSKN
ncbi:uncharacterized protein LOC130677528 [Microplitis mediator]|uniref:uncharacterized protein LOC130675747 n=1 Tax=Microplitis mediator TaxID=375433 RepID=UPI0025532713|nr:uncharacterized protein LOC130675747 [Microplitis mediator]XP_057340299.1 uncharacterized protein LOC130677528 [Microplitis mediator]